MPAILVASDLSEGSEHALARARSLAAALRAELSVLHVVDDAQPSRLAEAAARGARDFLEGEVDGAGQVEVVFGHPWRRVVSWIANTRPDLVVLGAHRESGLLELLRGSVMHRCVQMSGAPVLVVSGPPEGAYRRVMAATSFARRDGEAAVLAARLAEGMEVRLVHAYEIPFGGLGYRMDDTGDITKRDRESIEAPMLAEMEETRLWLARQGVAASCRLVEGPAARALIKAAVGGGVDLLAIGRHGVEGHAPMSLGRTASDILSRLPCDLLIHPGRPMHPT